MEHFDVAVISLGSAGSALARKLAGKMQVIASDKKHQHGAEGFSKPCGDPLTPDTQRSFIHDGLTPPIDVIASPQISSVKTIDVIASLTRNYRRSYIDINRHAFDLRMESLIPASVKVHHDSLCRKIWRGDDKWHVIFRADGWGQHITVRYLVGVDGASSMMRRHLYPGRQIHEYVAIQQWPAEKRPVPFYSCIFDNAITNCYPWNISKDGYSIFGGTYPIKDGRIRFATLKEKMSVFQLRFGKAVKNEKYTVLFPSRWQDSVCGRDDAFLIGEAAGFISASSLEGISYALNNTEILRSVLLKLPKRLNTAYWRATRKLRLKLLGKIVKNRCLTAPALGKWTTRSGVAHIPQLKDYPARFTSPTSRM